MRRRCIWLDVSGMLSTWVRPSLSHTLAALGVTAKLVGPLGVVLKVGYDYAPLLQNKLDQSHDDGGLSVGLALRLRGLRGAI